MRTPDQTRHFSELHLVRWFVPYLGIWGIASLYLRSLSAESPCIGLCAVYVGFEVYATVAVALVATALVAVAELLALHRWARER